jgi:hypothetical protein
MKYAEKANLRLLEIGEEIRHNKRNVRHGMAEVYAIAEAGKIAFMHTNHNKFHKRPNRVIFFDQNVPKPEEVEETPAAKVSGTLTITGGKKPQKVVISSKK